MIGVAAEVYEREVGAAEAFGDQGGELSAALDLGDAFFLGLHVGGFLGTLGVGIHAAEVVVLQLSGALGAELITLAHEAEKVFTRLDEALVVVVERERPGGAVVGKLEVPLGLAAHVLVEILTGADGGAQGEFPALGHGAVLEQKLAGDGFLLGEPEGRRQEEK